MTNSLGTALVKVHPGIGQGGVLEQIDKRYRKQQRQTLFEMLEKVDNKEVENFPAVLYKHTLIGAALKFIEIEGAGNICIAAMRCMESPHGSANLYWLQASVHP